MTTELLSKIVCARCGGHIEYPAEASGMSVPCPHCQQTIALAPRSKRRWPLVVVLSLTFVLAAGGAWFNFFKKPVAATHEIRSILPNPPPADLQRMDQLAFWDFSIQQKEGSTITHAVARVLNESGATRYGVEVRLELRDSLGRVIGTSRDYVERLEPNQDTTLRALVVKRDAASARLLDFSEQ